MYYRDRKYYPNLTEFEKYIFDRIFSNAKKVEIFILYDKLKPYRNKKGLSNFFQSMMNLA